MKKISLIMGFAALALGVVSCSEDRGPKYQNPTEFVLNIPAMESQYIPLTESGTLELICSQPDYGYSAVANYSAEVSLTQDFSSYEAITPVNNHLANMTFTQENVAIALCALLGLDSEDAFTDAYPDGTMPYMPVYFRAVCQLSGVDGSLIKSNIVQYQHIQPYFAVPTPGYIYLIGTPAGNWTEPSAGNADALKDWRLFEPDDAIGSKVYTATFKDFPAAPMFRFYTALTGWDQDSYGYQEPDEATDFPEFTGASSWTQSMIKGKGAYSFPNFQGGEVTIVVDMSDEKNMTVTVYPGSVDVVVAQYVYMVGNNAGWAEPSEASQEVYNNWRLADSASSGVYAATFDMTDVPDDTLYCRFYKELTGWGAAQWAANPTDGDNTEVALGKAYPTVVGEGCFVISGVNGHKLNVVLDTNVPNVTFTFAD